MENKRKGTATIVKHTGSHYMISELPVWDPFPVVIRGKLRLKETSATNPVAVGDIVEYEDGVITAVLPRKNYVIRKSVNLSREAHIIAANVDQAYLVVTLDFPETKWAFIDRFLVACESFKIPVRILLNKIDLYGESHRKMVDHFCAIYRSAGYHVQEISARDGIGMDTLREECRNGGISLFAGISGVGKSSIIKTIDPGIDPKIAEISESHLQGRHTTTFYEMYPLTGGGYIIDMPGIRGFGLIDIPPEEVSTYFPEMLRVTDSCRYKPCTHTHEPHCAVKEAVENGEIALERYDSYLGMLEEETKYRQ